MTIDEFFEKFELFLDAPDAVARMRDLVLRLAFTGGLSGPSSSQEEVPFGWERCTIESTCDSITPGFACSRNHQVEDGHVHLRTHNISTLGTLNFDLLVRIDPTMVDSQKCALRRGDILFNNTNSQELVGKTALVDRDYEYGFSNHITRLRLKDGISSGFVVLYLTMLRNSGHFARICTRWINQAAVNTDLLKKQTILLPPLAEQKRIVAKVDELMALFDRLEAQQRERETQHAALARASLARFAEAPTPANLDFLFHKSYDIAPADLRKSILTLAVQGKLVPQDPNDEPAKAIIERVLAIRDQTASGRMRKLASKTTARSDAESAFDVPDSWTWCRFGDLVLEFRYGTSRKCSRDAGNSPVLRIPNIKNGRIDSTDLKFTDMPEAEFEELRLRDGDLLLVRSNGSENLVGRSAVVCVNDEQFAYAGYLVRARLPKNEVSTEFLHVALSTPSVRDQIEGPIRTTSGVKNVNTTELSNLLFPLPPIAEQRRIVAKVNELMALVDRLEAQLGPASDAAANLLSAAVAELTDTKGTASAS